MRLAMTVVLLGSLLATTNVDAGGMFRRMPTVGENAIYETVLVVTSEDIEGFDVPEMAGTLTLQCVGVEEIEETKLFWLEVVLEVESQQAPLQFTIKLLLSESQIIEGDPVSDFARGWYHDSQLGEPIALEPAHMDIASDPMPLWVRTVFRGVHGESETLGQSQTIEIGDHPLQIATAEHGDFEPDELLDDTDLPNPLTGWGTWWLHEDAAFGVAATEQLWSIEVPDVGTFDFAIQCMLKEVGSGAVSALPEHE